MANGINSVRAANDDIILVHDAVRPFVTADIIDEVIAAAQKSGAAELPASPPSIPLSRWNETPKAP